MYFLIVWNSFSANALDVGGAEVSEIHSRIKNHNLRLKYEEFHISMSYSHV